MKRGKREVSAQNNVSKRKSIAMKTVVYDRFISLTQSAAPGHLSWEFTCKAWIFFNRSYIKKQTLLRASWSCTFTHLLILWTHALTLSPSLVLFCGFSTSRGKQPACYTASISSSFRFVCSECILSVATWDLKSS